MSQGPQAGLGIVSVPGVRAALRVIQSIAGIAIDTSSLPQARSVVSSGVEGTFNITHLANATEGNTFAGQGLTPNADGTITANIDMTGVKASVICVGTFSNAQNLSIGIGVGDPTGTYPTMPGESTTDVYVSRFRCARKGDGTRRVTFDFSPGLVGNVQGIKAGDKLFPVIWTPETSNVAFSIEELIFAVEEVTA